MVGVEPKFREWDGKGSLVGFVVSLNLKRRHLNSSQLAVVALEVEKFLAGEARQNQGMRNDLKSENTPNLFQIFEKGCEINFVPIHAAEQAAKITNTNRQYVSDAKRISVEAPEKLQKILAGEITIPEAKRPDRADRGAFILCVFYQRLFFKQVYKM